MCGVGPGPHTYSDDGGVGGGDGVRACGIQLDMSSLEQAAEPCRRGVYNLSLPPADNIISWPADKFRRIQARMLDRFHISGRSGDLAGAQRGNESSNGVDDDADVPGGGRAGNVGGCGNRAGALGAGRRRGGDDGGSGGGDGVRACGMQLNTSSLEQAAEPCRRGVYNLSLPPADNVLSWPVDKFRGFQARMLGRFHISDRIGDLAGAQCGNGGIGDGDDTDVQGVVPMECDNDLLPEWEDRNGRQWSPL